MEARRAAPSASLSPAALGVERLTAARAAALKSQFRDVYAAAFAEPPYNRGIGVAGSFARSFEKHTTHQDFRCAATLDAGGRLLGFAYGYACLPGQWWHDLVAGALGAPRRAEWLEGSFELVELAVMPAAQGRGLGSRLHDALLDGLPHPSAVLSTLQDTTTALHLYHRRGWVTLLERFIFPGSESPYRVMGRRAHG